MRHGREGFSLVELLVILAALGILLAGAVKIVGSVRERAKITRCLDDLNALQAAYTALQSDTGYYPPDGDIKVLWDQNEFQTKVSDQAAADKWRGPYWPKPATGDAPLNPWGGVYQAVYKDVDGDGYVDYGVLITNVPKKAAESIDIAIDNKKDGTDGKVRYSANAGNTGRVDVTVIFGSE